MRNMIEQLKIQMKVLAIISTSNFSQFTRRATIEAISKKVERLDLLFYTGIKNKWKNKISIKGIDFNSYHFWVPDSLKKYKIFTASELGFRGNFWRRKFARYDVLFFGDPNQAYLLPYVGKQKVVYLIRDPNVLQSRKQYENEQNLIKRAKLVLATSQNLTYQYILKYHQIQHQNVHYWPNCVDLNIWNVSNIINNRNHKNKVGIAGNFGIKGSDFNLLNFITSEETGLHFEIVGKIDSKASNGIWQHIINKKNVTYRGYVQFEKLPQVVGQWKVGLTTEKINEYNSYTHHNKVYQYLALGIPAVTLKIHNDYNHLHPHVQAVDNYHDYLNALDCALEMGKDDDFRNTCISVAHENASDKRAESWIQWVNEL